MNRKLERILAKVQKPARYAGGEYGAVIKDPDTVSFRFALCFPDLYEIGMSNLGMQILYGRINQIDGVWCERAFAPWADMEEEMRREGILLYGLESGESIRSFDLIGFSLGYELCYTNVLNMLDLAGLPLRAKDRNERMPLVMAGGTCAYNPEPMADFVDLFFLGEGEGGMETLVSLCRRAKQEGWSRPALLEAAAKMPGLYVPSLYQVEYQADGTVGAVTPKGGAPRVVTKRLMEDLARTYAPPTILVPSMEIIHDRVMLELFRGCIRGCRFCQAGYVYRPVRERPAHQLIEQGVDACKASGYQEITLLSLSSSDYPGIEAVCDGLLPWCQENHVGLSLPSLRADNFSMGLMERMRQVRKSGLTFAPEAGTQRLRDVINKNVTEEDLLESCKTAFSGGWSAVKLYFMLGLPTETEDDVLGIADLVQKVLWTWKAHAASKKKPVRITVSTSCFVPKPHTPFQWEGQVTIEEYRKRVALLRDALRQRNVTYQWHDAETSFVEAALARGDRRLARVIKAAWENGARMDAWSEGFQFGRWMAAFDSCGLDPAFYANRVRDPEEVLPWSVTSVGVSEAFFRRELARAYAGLVTPDCRAGCAGCGADKLCGEDVCHG